MACRAGNPGTAATAALCAFPPISRPLAIAGHFLIERCGIVEAAVEHHLGDLFGIADVRRRIGVKDDEVGKLARFDRTNILVITQRPSGLDRAGTQCLDRCHPATNKRVTEFSRNLEFEAWYQSLPDEVFDADGVFRPGEDGLWVMLERGYSGNVKLSVRTLHRFEDLDRAVDAWLYGQPARSEESVERLKEHISKDSMVRAHYNAPYAFYDLDLSALDKYLGVEA